MAFLLYLSMSTDWSINYKGNELVLKDGFLISYREKYELIGYDWITESIV